MTKKDKQRVEGEQWQADQFEEFLHFTTTDQTDNDFHCLYRAYTRMNAEAFTAFVQYFRSLGRNTEATNLAGQTLDELISQHHNSADYRAALQS